MDEQRLLNDMENNIEPTTVESVGEDSVQKYITLEKLYNEEKASKLRYLADYQNLQKRMIDQLADARNNASIKLLSYFLDFSDDFERGLIHAKSGLEIDDVKNSFDGIYEKLKLVFEKLGIVMIDVNIGDQFDPNLMEAVTIIPGGNGDKVKDIISTGYMYKDTGKIIKPVKIIVI